MRSVAAFVSFLLASFVLASCEHVLDMVLFNNAGEPITVNAGPGSFIAPGQSTHFHYPRSETNWTLLISAGACDYLYQAPKSLEHYPWPIDYKTDPTVQLERDFSIWAVPPDAAGTSDVSGLAPQQKDGFPLHPVARNCH